MGNSAFGIGIFAGIQRIIDAQLKFTRTTNDVYLRVKNFTDPQTSRWAQLGFTIAPIDGSPTGTNDVLIWPPPASSDVSIHNIGQSMGKLFFGATQFFVSATWVDAQAVALGFTDPWQVWRDPSIVGLVSEGIVYSIENIVPQQYGGKTVTWSITTNRVLPSAVNPTS